MADSYSLDSLNMVLPKELPVIIVSSGPSLTKNINDLKTIFGGSTSVLDCSAPQLFFPKESNI